MPIVSSVELFRDEYVAHVENRGCPFEPAATALAAMTAEAAE
jgi:NADH-quinone oxidoreductase subunit F